jgi:hypothetical protein
MVEWRIGVTSFPVTPKSDPAGLKTSATNATA